MKLNDENKYLIFPIIVLVLSSISLINNLMIPYYFSIIVSIIGIIGAVITIKQKSCNHHLLEIWLFVQIPYITTTFYTTPESPQHVEPFINAAQSLSIPLGLHFGSKTEMLYLGINILPLLIIGALKYFKIPYQKEMGKMNYSNGHSN